MKTDQISIEELKLKLAANEAIFLLDVRNPDEHANYNIGGTLIPLSTLPNQIDDIPRDIPIVVYCRSGCRSQTALEYLQSQGFQEVYNLVGGVLAWEQFART
jgi:rhodanese-related sulfurtransferase